MTDLLKAGIPLRIFGVMEENDLPERSEMVSRAAWCLLKEGSIRNAWGYFRRWVVPSEHERRIRTLRSVVSSPLYGLDMYRVLAASRLTINTHVDSAGSRAGNMRMFEATGMGSCLVTEHMENIDDLFEPGVEVETYTSTQELVQIAHDLIEDSERSERIARAGQARTFRCHTIESMWESISPAFEFEGGWL